MPRFLDITRIRTRAVTRIDETVARFSRVGGHGLTVADVRWVAAGSLVSIHAAWERFAEERLASELNNAPQHFLTTKDVRGISRIPKGLAVYLSRRGGKYFDFRSSSDLISRADEFLPQAGNPYRAIPLADRSVLDCMAAIRNVVVHHSDSSWASYRRALRTQFNIRSAPSPGEFLDSIDRRQASPTRGQKRLHFFAHIARQVVSSI